MRRSFREDGKVKHETLANLSALPDTAVVAVRASLTGAPMMAAGDQMEIVRSRPHGHLAAIWAQARTLGLPGLLGPAGPRRDLVMALYADLSVMPMFGASSLVGG